MEQAIRAVAGVTMAAGLLVLAGVAAALRRRRVYEAVVLKVLGATRADLLKALLAEHLMVGLATAAVAEIPRVDPKDAAKLVAEGKAVLVDIREPAEWEQTGVAAPAVLLPKSDFDSDQKKWKEFLRTVGRKQVILYCGSGRRADVVGEKLVEKGVLATNAGGFRDWTAAGLPTREASAPAKK